VGTCLELGHGGSSCPTYQDQEGAFHSGDNDLGDLRDDEQEPEGFGWANPGRPSRVEVKGLKIILVVHTNGIHHIPLRPCICPNAPPEDIQMLCMRFYPSTYKNIKTIFTFQLLDDYLLKNLEC
jgi:hypothetical protein